MKWVKWARFPGERSSLFVRCFEDFWSIQSVDEQNQPTGHEMQQVAEWSPSRAKPELPDSLQPWLSSDASQPIFTRATTATAAFGAAERRKWKTFCYQ